MSYSEEKLDAEFDDDEFDDSSDDELNDFSNSEKKINFKTPQRLIQDLYRSYKDGDLDTAPDFQRGYVWEKTKASRLIEQY